MAKIFEVEAKVKEDVMACAREGIPRNSTYDYVCAKYDNMPSYPTFSKLYNPYYNLAKTNLDREVGSQVIQKAVEGDLDAAKFYLERKGGWRKEDVTVGLVGDLTEEEKDSARQTLFDKIIPSKDDSDE